MPSLEQQVEAAIAEHLAKISNCLDGYVQLVDAYLSGDGAQAETLWEDVDRLEHEADIQRREVARLLYEGAFMPLTREDFMGFVEAADKIANAAEAATDTLTLTRPRIPDAFKPRVRELVAQSVSMMPALADAAACVFTDFERAIKQTRTVDEGEDVSDQIEWHLVRDVFASDIELAHKLQLRQVIEEFGKIADRIENAADRLETLVVKKQF